MNSLADVGPCLCTIQSMTAVISIAHRGHEGQPGITPYGAGHAADLAAMVARCSPESLYHRFHGPVGTAERAVGLLAGGGQQAYLAWAERGCVAVASLGDGTDGSAHIGVLVADAWQRRGIGSLLVGHLAQRARQLGMGVLTADVLFEDRFILRLLARLGPVSTVSASPGYTARVELVRPRRAGA